MDLHTLIVLGHVVGTILGVGGATIAEVQIVRALKDRKIDASERALMHANYWVIRVGMAVIAASAVALIWYHLGQGNGWVLTSAKIQTKDLMFLALVVNAVLLTKRLVPLWLGSAISFTSWWGATILGVAHRLPYTLTEFVIGYVVAVFIVAAVLEGIRRFYLR